VRQNNYRPPAYTHLLLHMFPFKFAHSTQSHFIQAVG